MTSSKWTEHEVTFLLDHPELTAKNIAKIIGRTRDSVTQKRRSLKHLPEATWGERNKNPFNPGRRAIVARTCDGCGLLLDASWFTATGQGFRFYKCRSCSSSAASQRGNGSRELRNRMNDIARERAIRLGHEITNEDIEICSDPDLSLFQMALRTKRTIFSVASIRHNSGLSSRLSRLADPADVQWIIRFNKEEE